MAKPGNLIQVHRVSATCLKLFDYIVPLYWVSRLALHGLEPSPYKAPLAGQKQTHKKFF